MHQGREAPEEKGLWWADVPWPFTQGQETFWVALFYFKYSHSKVSSSHYFLASSVFNQSEILNKHRLGLLGPGKASIVYLFCWNLHASLYFFLGVYAFIFMLFFWNSNLFSNFSYKSSTTDSLFMTTSFPINSRTSTKSVEMEAARRCPKVFINSLKLGSFNRLINIATENLIHRN